MTKTFPQPFKDSAREQWRRHVTLYQTILGNGDLRFSTPNYTVSVQCYAKSGYVFAANMGPAARVQPSGDRYLAVFVSGTNDLRLYKNIGGVNTLLANSTGLGRNPNDGYTLTITVSGSTISATFNDGSSLSVSATDSSLASGTRGLRRREWSTATLRTSSRLTLSTIQCSQITSTGRMAPSTTTGRCCRAATGTSQTTGSG